MNIQNVATLGKSRSVLSGDFDLRNFLQLLWHGRLAIAIITTAIAAGGTAYALLAREWFKAEVVMVQTDDKTSLSGSLAQLGGLASLAGINIGAGGMSQTAIAVLKSKELAREFISDRGLIKVLLADRIDPVTGDWKVGFFRKRPDIRDAVKYFQRKVYSVAEDKKAGVVTLSVTWRNAETSAAWANELVRRANTKMRDRTVEEAQRNINYLKNEMVTTNVTSLQQAIGRVLESQMQKLMLARGNDEYAFKIIDRAVPPKERSWPLRVLVVIGSVIAGLLASAAYLVVANEFRLLGVSAVRKA